MSDPLAEAGGTPATLTRSGTETGQDLTERILPSWSGKDVFAVSPEGRAARGIPHYRLLGPLGIGGMGVVYRAEDTRLGRIVALKFLPPALTPDAQAKARFLLEARAAAAIDHPNVCTIYEVGETADGQLYLAMACYDGETLKTRLERGLTSVSEAVRITRQVARGLAQAHRHGIIHRDVKPANLMITADGTVKILDFGIAQLPAWTGLASVCPLPGTPAYMSPEQARGARVDARSDLWSLGVVLYEMLAGCRPDRQASAAIGPERLLRELRRPDVPPRLGHMLCRLLAPDPDDRPPEASALLEELEGMGGRAAGPSRASSRTATSHWLLASARTAAAALAVGCGYWLLNTSSGWPGTRPGSMHAHYLRLTDLPGREQFPSLSSDGKFFLYAKSIGGRSHIFLQRVGGSNPQDLTRDAAADDTQPAFSPDSREIAFRSERDGGGIFVMGATGESVRRLTNFGFNPAWSPNGREIVCGTGAVVHPGIRPQPSELYRVSVATGERHLVRGRDAAQPSWSPHGYRIAYWGVTAGQRIIWTVAADGGQPVRVTDEPSLDWNPVWSPDGRYLYFASDRSGVMNLWRVAIDEGTGRVLGKPEPVTVSSGASAQFGISPPGEQLIFASDDLRVSLEKIGFEPATGRAAGRPQIITETSQTIIACDASRDGRWLAYQTLEPREDIFVIHPDGTGLRLLAGEGFRNRMPRWSGDSSRVAFYSNRGGNYEIWTVNADGSRLLPATALHAPSIYHPIWSPDGSRLACDFGEQEALIDLGRTLAARRPVFLPAAGPRLGFTGSSWSMDGRWLAGVLHGPGETRLPGIVLYSVAERRYVRLTGRGDGPCWLSDSRSLLYLDDREIYLLDTRTGRQRRVLEAPVGSHFNDMVLSPDDRVLYLVHVADEGDIWLLSQAGTPR
jgi:Tol biopolymer transport system component